MTTITMVARKPWLFETFATIVLLSIWLQSLCISTNAFQIHHRHFLPIQQQQHQQRRPCSILSSSSLPLHEFDFILKEDNNGDSFIQRATHRRHVAVAIGGNDDPSQVLLVARKSASRVEAPVQVEDDYYDWQTTDLGDIDDSTESLGRIAGATVTTTEDSTSSSANPVEETEDDPYGAAMNAQKNKMRNYQQRQQLGSPSGLTNRLKEMDLSDLILTIALPAIVVFAAGKWGLTKVSTRVNQKTATLLDAFAREMLFHDTDHAELKLCVQDYSKRLVYLGPVRNSRMLKAYLETFAKRRTVSPHAITTLSYVFSLFSLSEEQSANLLVSLCNEMGTEKISSAGKLLFLASRIFKSPAGLKGLEPIKKLIMSTYREMSVAETMVESSQQAMAEAAYRTTVQSGGKKQSSLTPGWEILGLTREKALEIYNDEAKEGFMSARETMYGGQTTKYDKKGNVIGKDGKTKSPDSTVPEKTKDGSSKVSNVYECSDCGYTLFVAQGREAKFFGTNFKCPECGAAKDKFQARDEMDE